MHEDLKRQIDKAFADWPNALVVLVYINDNPGLEAEEISHHLDIHPIEVAEILTRASKLNLLKRRTP